MSVITIHCRLVASESTRHQLWELMSKKNTPLINELLWQVSQQPEFEDWCSSGRLPSGIVGKLCNQLKTDSRYEGQPSRFYQSALTHVEYIYKSYLRLQRRLRWQLRGQQRWLEMLKSDPELVELAKTTLESIRQNAQQILPRHQSSLSLSQSLFDAYDHSLDPQEQVAIAFLLKNGCRLSEKEEDPDKFKLRRRKVEIRIRRLEKQIEGSRQPRGRNLTDEPWLNTLTTMASTIPKDNQQAAQWQAQLLSSSKSVPYPIDYGTNEDLYWHKDSNGRLCVRFNGLSEHTFKLYCDQRQLHWFERFYEDQQVKKQCKNQHSSALFTLRSGMLAWSERKGKQEPWNNHRLTLYCSLDTRLWSAEGTEQIRQEKATEVAQILTKMREKKDLTKNQEAFIKRKESTLARLNNPFPRPNQPLYQGQSHLLLAVAMTQEKPATVAVVNALTGKVITYRSTKQLLGANYHLLHRQRKQKERLSHHRHKTSRLDTCYKATESELGEYIDRLLASAIIQVAMSYQVGSIVIPDLGNIREVVQTEMQAKAEHKIPGCVEAQKEYLKQYRMSVHRWSYARLCDCISGQAKKNNLFIEKIKQPTFPHPTNIAKNMALLAYQNRKNEV